MGATDRRLPGRPGRSYHPRFDFTVVHPNTYPLVQRILGGEDKPRMIEFNYRGWDSSGGNVIMHHPVYFFRYSL
jgi:hypothetical protein